MSTIDEVDVFLNIEGKKHLIGLLARIESTIYFEYTPSFLQTGLELSPFKLPLKAGAQQCDDNVFEGLFGLFNDALPDGWGRLLTDRYLKSKGLHPEKTTPLERLLYVGSDAIGALEFEPHFHTTQEYRDIIDLDQLHREMQKTLEGDADEVLEQLLLLNGSSAGARPKALVQVSQDKQYIYHHQTVLKKNYEHWLIKFPNSLDSPHAGVIEYAYSLMARSAGLEMSETYLFKRKKAPTYFGTKRFDRDESRKHHVHTLCGLVHSDFRLPSLDYDDLLTVTMALTKDIKECQKAFRLACFNVLAHNRDDHEKNVSFILKADGVWKLAPAYDLTFSSGPNGWQSMTVMGEGQQPSIKELIQLAKNHDIPSYDKVIQDVKSSILEWEKFATIAGVDEKEIKRIDKVLRSSLSDES